MQRVFQLLISAAVLVTATPYALAQNSLVEAPPASETRWITQEKATSNCIGDLTDPLCTAETLIACWARVEPDLCRLVHDETPDPVPTPDLQPYEAEYKVKSVRILTDGDTRVVLDLFGVRPGFAQVVLLRRFPDSDNAVDPDRAWMKYYYYLKLVEGQWRVFAWVVHFDNEAEAAETRRIGQDSATSDCIGNQGTLLCTVETDLACIVRKDERLCAKTYAEPNPDSRYLTIEYSLIGIHTIRPEDISNTLLIQKQTEIYRPGIVNIWFRYRFHLKDGSTYPPEKRGSFECLLEPDRENWRIVDCTVY